MSKLLEDLDWLVCLMYDMLIVGIDQQEHDAGLTKLLERVQSADVSCTECREVQDIKCGAPQNKLLQGV